MTRHLRFALVLLAMLLLGILIRIGAVWDGVSDLTQGGGLVAEAAASEAKPDAHQAGDARTGEDKPGENKPRENDSGENDSGENNSGEHKPGQPAASARTASMDGRPQPACAPLPPSGPAFSEPEIAVLQQLAQRRDALDQREQELERQRMLLAAVETRIADKLAAMEKLQAVLESVIKRNDAEMESRIRSLVKIYELMKPADAARIFEALDMDTLLPVAERMNERRLAPVMAQMDPAKARDVTERLKTLRDLTGQAVP
jgi:flagellar motility protein MotE (MotC chaperone)